MNPITNGAALKAPARIRPPTAELAQITPISPERVDAARNRQAILAAAARLLRAQGARSITMDRLADEAGVGKGTLFRRFGDRSGLFYALLDETEREFQEGFIRGPAPLGPGADAIERLTAFGRELIALTESRGELLLAAQPPNPDLRYVSPVYCVYRAHVRSLVAELGAFDPEYVADILLAGLSPCLIAHQLARGLSCDELADSWAELVRRVGS